VSVVGSNGSVNGRRRGEMFRSVMRKKSTSNPQRHGNYCVGVLRRCNPGLALPCCAMYAC